MTRGGVTLDENWRRRVNRRSVQLSERRCCWSFNWLSASTATLGLTRAGPWYHLLSPASSRARVAASVEPLPGAQALRQQERRTPCASSESVVSGWISTR